jgi:hypothetical protein
MEEEPKWITETKWILSAFAAMLAVLVVFWALAGLAGGLAQNLSGSQDVSPLGSSAGPQDGFGDYLFVVLIAPTILIVRLPLYFLAALVGFRLLVPTFAGVEPRVVGVLCTVWAIGLGAVTNFADPLGIVLITIMGAACGLAMPIPKKSLLEAYGPYIGGAVAGLALASVAWLGIGLPLGIVWTAWRLYKRHPEEATTTALFAAVLPAILALHDLGSSSHDLSTAFTTIQIVVLLAIAFAGFVMASARPVRAD